MWVKVLPLVFFLLIGAHYFSHVGGHSTGDEPQQSSNKTRKRFSVIKRVEIFMDDIMVYQGYEAWLRLLDPSPEFSFPTCINSRHDGISLGGRAYAPLLHMEKYTRDDLAFSLYILVDYSKKVAVVEACETHRDVIKFTILFTWSPSLYYLGKRDSIRRNETINFVMDDKKKLLLSGTPTVCDTAPWPCKKVVKT